MDQREAGIGGNMESQFNLEKGYQDATTYLLLVPGHTSHEIRIVYMGYIARPCCLKTKQHNT